MHDARPGSYFHQCAKLCERVPTLRLIRPRSAATMSDVVQLLEQGILNGAQADKTGKT